MGPPGTDLPGGGAAAQTRRLVYDDDALQIWRAAEPPGLIIAGEIDENGYPALLRHLAALAKVHAQDVHVAMADVVYCDLAGLRAIVSLAGSGGERRGQPRRVILHDLPAHLLAALRIVGWDVTPGLVLAP